MTQYVVEGIDYGSLAGIIAEAMRRNPKLTPALIEGRWRYGYNTWRRLTAERMTRREAGRTARKVWNGKR